MRTNITPWARATMTPEDWTLIREAEPRDAMAHIRVNHRNKRVILDIIQHKRITHSGTGRTVREAWDARYAIVSEIVSLIDG